MYLFLLLSYSCKGNIPNFHFSCYFMSALFQLAKIIHQVSFSKNNNTASGMVGMCKTKYYLNKVLTSQWHCC